ncbi:MAG TPA: aldo/keto reductase, partial [Nakamurella sp.]|nr:aldo/keto reductase [Nakamurella sp.]
VAIGFSTSGARQGDIVERALEVTRADARLFSAVQATWNLLETSAGPALQAASRRELTVIVKESLANGRLVTEPPDALLEVCARIGAAPDAVALAAAAAQPWANRVLIGAAGVEQLAANLRADQVELTPADSALLSGCAEDPEDYWAHRSGLPWR